MDKVIIIVFYKGYINSINTSFIYFYNIIVSDVYFVLALEKRHTKKHAKITAKLNNYNSFYMNNILRVYCITSEALFCNHRV